MVTEQRLLIFGSDKRGTIYGMFHISELMGVSPWVTFADVVPERKDEVYMIEADTFYSKEPSVKYRGFLSMMSGRHLETGHFLILVVSQPKCTI